MVGHKLPPNALRGILGGIFAQTPIIHSQLLTLIDGSSDSVTFKVSKLKIFKLDTLYIITSFDSAC